MVNYRNSHTHLTGTFAWYVAAALKLTTCVICLVRTNNGSIVLAYQNKSERK